MPEDDATLEELLEPEETIAEATLEELLLATTTKRPSADFDNPPLEPLATICQ